MDHQIIAATITAATAVLLAIGSFFLNERAKRKADWQQKKFKHYQKLVQAISDLANADKAKGKVDNDFWTASNTIVLIASQEVINTLMLLQDEISWANKDNFSRERHDRLLKDLILAIRKDIGLSRKDDPSTFNFHLIGSNKGS